MMRNPPEKSSLLTLASITTTSSVTILPRLASSTSEYTVTSRGSVPSSICTKAILPRLPILVRCSMTTPASMVRSREGSSWASVRRTKRRTSGLKALKGWPERKKPIASFSSLRRSRSLHPLTRANSGAAPAASGIRSKSPPCIALAAACSAASIASATVAISCARSRPAWPASVSMAPARISASMTRRFTMRRSTRSQKSNRSRKSPPFCRAARIARTAGSPTPFTAPRP